MNRFQFIWLMIFKSIKRTLGLLVSYVSSALLMLLAYIMAWYGSDSSIIAIFSIVIFFVGFIGLIDTIVWQVKSYNN